ncbi:MAG: hypothetical protein V3U34_00460 [candidate division NC10 bacterium]
MLTGPGLNDEQKAELWERTKNQGTVVDFGERQPWMGEEIGAPEAPTLEPQGLDRPADPDVPTPETRYEPEVPYMLAAEVLPPLLGDRSGPAVDTSYLDDPDVNPLPNVSLSEENAQLLRDAKGQRNYPSLKNDLQKKAVDAYRREAVKDYDETRRNWTKKQSMYAPPTVGDIEDVMRPVSPMLPGMPAGTEMPTERAYPYLHQEPSLESVIEMVERWPESGKRDNALASLDKEGEGSVYYTHQADSVWKAVYNEFKRTGEAAVRVHFMDYDTASKVMTKIVGLTAPTLDAVSGGIDAAILMGAHTQARRGAHHFKAEGNLKKAGLIPESQVLTAMRDRPVSAGLGEAGGYIQPIGAGGMLMTGVRKGVIDPALRKMGNNIGTRILAEVVAGTPAGMIMGGGQELMKIGGDTESAERRGAYDPDFISQETATRMKSQMSRDAHGALLAPLPEFVGSAGKALVRRLEEGKSFAGRRVRQSLAEIGTGETGRPSPGADPDLEPGRRMARTFRSPPGQREAAPIAPVEPGYKELELEQLRERTTKGVIQDPSRLQAERYARTALPSLSDARTKMRQHHGSENENYYHSPEGQKTVEVDDFVEELGDIIEGYKIEGKKAPFVPIKDLEKAHHDFRHFKQEKKLKFDAQGILEWQDVTLEAPIRVNAREFDNILKGIDKEMHAAASSGVQDWRLQRVNLALRKIYDKFDPDPVSREPWKSLKSRHHTEMNEMEGTVQSFGLPKDIKEIDPVHKDQLRAVMNKVAQNPADDAAMVGFIKKNPALRKEWERLVRAIGWERMKGGATWMPGDINRRAMYQKIRLYSDPVWHAMSLLEGTGHVAATAAQDPEGTVNEMAQTVMGTNAERRQRNLSQKTGNEKSAVYKMADWVTGSKSIQLEE